MVNHEFVKGTIGLFFSMFGRLGIFAIILIIFTRFTAVKKFLTGKASRYEKLGFAVVFGIFGIIGNILGVSVDGAIANWRAVGVILGGILGGPLVGLCAGIIAGAERYLTDIGGFTAPACSIATVVEGFAGGFLYRYMSNLRSKRQKKFDAAAALITGIIMEMLHMLIILVIVKPFDGPNGAFSLVKVIAGPMVVVNAVGLAIFVEMLSSIKSVLILPKIIFYQGKTAFPKITPEKIVFFHCQYGKVPGNTYKGEVLGHIYDDIYEVKETMHELEDILSVCHFFRAHRSYLVNLNYVVEYKQLPNNSYQLTMDDKEKTKVPVSRYKGRDFLNAISDF